LGKWGSAHTFLNGRWILVLDGEIYNLQELLKKYQIILPAGIMSPPQICLHLVLELGEQIVGAFNGLFCMFLYETQRKILRIFSDRFAFRPLFYLLRGETFLCGTELKAITAVDPGTPSIDELGLLSLFCFGSHIMDRTWLNGYKKLPPASILTVSEKGITIERYWEYRYDETAPPLDQPTYYTGFRLLLDRAVERCMQGEGRLGLFLSGGYDSRSVAAAIRQYHAPVPAFTFGYAQARDVQYAKNLAKRLGLPHFHLHEQKPYLMEVCPHIIWRSEGMISFYNQTSIRYHSVLKEYADIFLLGILGEFSGSHTWPELFMTRNRKDTIHAVFRKLMKVDSEELKGIFQSSFFLPVFEELKSEFTTSFNTISNEKPINIADCWQFHHFQHRNTFQAPSVDRCLFEVRGPHLDVELVQFLLAIPPWSRLEQRVYKKMIAYGFPDIRDIPCTNSGKPINPNFAWEYLDMASRYLGRKIAVPMMNFTGWNPGLGREFRDPAEELCQEPQLREILLESLLRSEIFPEWIFKVDGIRNLVNEHYEKKKNHAELIYLLITIGVAFEFFSLREKL
jgi:hypothetical protein